MKQIGNYTYNQKFCLGEGAFGKVYEGTSKTGKRVAVKRIDKQIIQTDNYLRSSIEGQIQILKKFNHPNIVYLQDMVLTSNNIYIITEFCKNGDLKQYLKMKKLSEQQALHILTQILNGFMEIEKLGVVHRDLKPANILISDNTFKICDFGFAKYSKQIEKMNKTCVGTPLYMSPQVLKGKPYTNKTDIWSLGILTYQMMFGRTPWQGNTEDNLYRNIIDKGLQMPHCSNYVYDLLKGMLEVQQQKRWDWRKLFQYTKLSSNKQTFSKVQQIKPNLIINQNPKPQVNEESLNIQLNLKGKSPRYLYYIITELHINRIQSVSMRQLISSLLGLTISYYSRIINNNQDINNIMLKQLQILKSISTQKLSNPTTIGQIQIQCMTVLKQLQKYPNHPSKQLIQQILQML